MRINEISRRKTFQYDKQFSNIQKLFISNQYNRIQQMELYISKVYMFRRYIHLCFKKIGKPL